VSGGTTWTSSSDRRLKENIRPTQYGLDTILKLPVHEYNFKNTLVKRNVVGLVAQEVYPILPEVVDKEDDGEKELGPKDAPWGVSYEEITPVLIQALQDLNRKMAKENAELRARLEKLESRLAPATPAQTTPPSGGH
jgi:hypothetical protein